MTREIKSSRKHANQKKIITLDPSVKMTLSPSENGTSKIPFLSLKKARNETGYFGKIEKIWEEAGTQNFLRLNTDPGEFQGRLLKFRSKSLVNFGSCGYFGLEFDKRLRDGAKSAIDHYGTQFAFPPVYFSTSLYEELKEHYAKIFNGHVVIASTSTLGHLAAIPILVEKDDAVILDQQVHNSVQMAIRTIPHKVPVKTISHNNLDQLESEIKKLRALHRKVWYFADGVYSMHGDFAPISQLEQFRDMYPELNLYIDDAHGMSWEGKNGCGYALHHIKNRERIVIMTSHAKCFGSGGGTLVFDNSKQAHLVRQFGPTMIFSGPMQPSILGACLASAKIHLTDEIVTLQNQLKDLIAYRNSVALEFELPVIGPSLSPILFIEIGSHQRVGKILSQLLHLGFYANAALFPAVGLRRNGIRITSSLVQSKEDIRNFCSVLCGIFSAEGSFETIKN